MSYKNYIEMFDDIEAVIFDLDGTLIDSMWIWKQIDIDFLGRYGKDLPEGLQKCIEGYSFTETAVYFKERFELKESIDEIKNIWNDMAYQFYNHIIPVKSNVLNLLSVLKERGIQMGIATSNSRELVDLVLKRFELKDYFKAVITSCDVNKGKPNPDVYLYTAEKIGVNPKNCLVFEDVHMGIMAGKNAGMRVCAISDDFSKKDETIIKEAADYFIDDYKICLDVLDDEYHKKEA